MAAACLALAGCATYQAKPLADGPDLAASPRRLTVDVAQLRLKPLKAHRFDPSRGLDPTDVAILAALNNPDLKAKRAAANVAAAQAFSAGLLPDPQVTYSLDVPVTAGAVTGYNVSPSLDIMALVTHSAALKAAKAAARQADLELLWNEWTTAQQARQLAVTALADEQKADVLDRLATALAVRQRQSQAALDHGDATSANAGADLAAKIDAEVAVTTARHDAEKARGDLDALLGLDPGVRLDLVSAAPEVDPAPDALDAARAALPRRRPDLLALQAGYDSQNANLRKAILAQFPVLNLGFSHASDTTPVVTNGFSATFVVPIFNRGRGEIAVQSASRDQLRAEYQARLDQVQADVAAAWRERETSRRLILQLRSDVPRLVAAATQAEAPYRKGDIDGAVYLALQQAALAHQAALLDQQLAFELAGISLETILFIPSDVEARP
jgi:outer membrane protein TolC